MEDAIVLYGQNGFIIIQDSSKTGRNLKIGEEGTLDDCIINSCIQPAHTLGKA